jgi:hemolytic enterotoxin HBL
MSTAPAYSIAPGDIATAGTPGGPSFILSKAEWIAIQTYVNDGLSLPTTIAQFRASLGTGAPSDLSDFTQLITAYATLNGHCTTWQSTTFPMTVSLASDIYEYGTNKVPVFYPAILTEANILINDPTNANALAALAAILNNLQAAANGYQVKAKAASDAIQTFSNQMTADESTLIGPNGDAGLRKYYTDKYGTTSAQVAQYTQELAAWKLALAGDQAAYRHDVIVAATTPTYAWVFPYGTIAAAIVAGIYGHKAVEALDSIANDQKQIDALQADLAADANLINAINMATGGITGIVAALQAALPVVQKIQGVWQGISDDIAAIAALIDTDIRQVPPIIMSLGVSEATTAWYNVAQAANQYRVNAYVTTSGGAVASMEAWKLRTLIASSRKAA